MIFLLGLLDIIAGLALLSLSFTDFFASLALVLAIYLLIKSLVFLKTFASIVDIIVVIFFFLAFADIYNIMTYLSVIWLLQKGILSFL